MPSRSFTIFTLIEFFGSGAVGFRSGQLQLLQGQDTGTLNDFLGSRSGPVLENKIKTGTAS